MKTLVVQAAAEKRIRRGICVLREQDFPPLSAEDGPVFLSNTKGQFLGTAYLAKENKGIGWFISEKEVVFHQAFFEELFSQAKALRSNFESSSETTAYRVFHQDGDGFGGLTVDLYGEVAVFSWYNAYVYSIRDVIVAAFQTVFPGVTSGYEKIRFKGLEYESGHLFGPVTEEPFTIVENGVRYQVFMNDGLMTGIFLDQHAVRNRLVEGLASGKSLLNLFSYTAAFSVAAAMGGARETTSVDLAKRSRELSEAHFAANGLPQDNHRLVVMDVFEYFRYAKRKGLQYEVIVIDPPSFARNKKQTFSVAKDYHKLVSQALDILAPKGQLVLSTNAANLSLAAFQAQIDKGMGQTPYRVLTTDRLPSDFHYNKKDEMSNYLKVVTLQVTR